ncbi:MAG: FAD-binding oxidoreductase [Hyphomicrobiales bacterium]
MASSKLDHLYGPAVYAGEAPSLWRAQAAPPGRAAPPLAGEVSCDVAIIGAGFTGLSAALTLARDHAREVVVLDAGAPGWGASGRNAGFCCLGGAKLAPAAMARRYGIDAARAFDRLMVEAVDLVAGTLEREGIAARHGADGDYELLHRPLRPARMRAEASDLAARFGCRAEALDSAGLAARGLAASGHHGAIFIEKGFGLDPLAYVTGLADAAMRAGVRVHGASPVFGWRGEGGEHHLATPRGRVRARDVIIAVNGYHPRGLFPRAEQAVMPALSRIGVTRPLTATEIADQGWRDTALAYDSRNLLHYFRLLPDGRFLFGGRGGLALDEAATAASFAALRRRFEAMFPAWRDVPFQYQWSGFVALAFDLVPHVWSDPAVPGIHHAHLYHGNGVAMASLAGRALARLVAEGPAASGLPDFMLAPPPVPAFPALRRQYLRLAYQWYGARDRGLFPALDVPGFLARFLSR